MKNSYGIYYETLKTNKEKMDRPIEKWPKDVNRHARKIISKYPDRKGVQRS